MPFVEPCKALYSFKARGRLGRPMLFGHIMPGWSQFGEEIELAGVYQQRRRRVGNNHEWRIGDPKPLNFFMRPTWPENPQYENQQIWRGSFADAVSAWQALTTEQKTNYNKIAIKLGRHGYNFFISQFLKSL